MYTPTPRKRKRGIRAVEEGDEVLADVVARRTVTVKKKNGTTVTKEIWVSLDEPTPTMDDTTPNITPVNNPPEIPTFENDPPNMSPPPNMDSPPLERTQTYRVSKYN